MEQVLSQNMNIIHVIGGALAVYVLWRAFDKFLSAWLDGMGKKDYVTKTDCEACGKKQDGSAIELRNDVKAMNLIPSGKAVLPYDIDGRARRNDGSGVAGAYERSLFINGYPVVTWNGSTITKWNGLSN